MNGDNLVKKIVLYSCFLTFVMACSSSKAYPIDKILTDNALSCNPEPQDNISAVYAAVFDEKSEINKLSKSSLMIGNLKLTHIKSFELQNKNIALSLTFDYLKHDVKITKLAFLTSSSQAEDEWGGYYYVVEGDPISFEKFRVYYRIDDDEIMRTPSGNYRVTCVMAG